MSSQHSAEQFNLLSSAQILRQAEAAILPAHIIYV